MKVIEVSGTAREIGRATGEALRDDIRAFREIFPANLDSEAWRRRLPRFLDAARRHIPLVLEELEATAEGADFPLDDILQMNFPMYASDLLPGQGCTNIVYGRGPDGPIWGKNNDGGPPRDQMPICARVVRRNDAIPLVTFTFCGMIATIDAMNAEGVAVGHSSVGSRFQQSDDFVPIRPWSYEVMMKSRTTEDFVRNLSSLPTRGKGYSITCVDAHGSTCSIDAACPLTQVNRPRTAGAPCHCVNCYQHPHLAEADRRNEAGKQNALARWRLLDQKTAEKAECTLDEMMTLLRYHGNPSICRHGGKDQSHSHYSMIGLPQSRRVLYAHGYPCQTEFSEIAL